MNFVVRWYNQNRRMIWIVSLTIVGVIALIQTLDNYYKNNPSSSTSNYNKNNYSVISEQRINENTAQESVNLIDDFFEYCNDNQIEYAYSLLSEDCKEELYPTIDDFKTKYYNRIFTEKKSYDSMFWITNSNRNTYRIQIMKDLLSAGQKDLMPMEDYYTIVYENGEYKLNINNYIGKQNITASKSENEITINVLSKRMYMDYETYEIQVKNNTGDTLIINTKDKSDSLYIQDENELKHMAFLSEITKSQLEILNGFTKTIQIRFNRGYNPTINIEKIVFGNIFNNKQRQKIEVDL